MLNANQWTERHVVLVPSLGSADHIFPPFSSRQWKICYAMIGSANSSQSPRIRGPCCASHGARGGRSGLPARMVSIPLTIPMSSLGSCTRFCISSWNPSWGHELGKASSSIVFGPLGAGGPFGGLSFLTLEISCLFSFSLWGSRSLLCGDLSLLLFPIGCGELRFFFLLTLPKLKHVLEVSCFLPSAFLNRIGIEKGFLEV